MTALDDPRPNHHAHYPAFDGLGGFLAALTFSIGRTPMARLAIELAAVTSDDDVVDVGCGPGVAARLASAAGARSVVGVDPAPVMLRVARLWPTRNRVRYLAGSAERLPTTDDTASIVWSLSTVHHWQDVEAGLAECRRVLRVGGRLLAIERLVDAGATGHESHGWTPAQAQSFADACRTAGFGEVTVTEHPGRRGQVLAVFARRV